MKKVIIPHLVRLPLFDNTLVNLTCNDWPVLFLNPWIITPIMVSGVHPVVPKPLHDNKALGLLLIFLGAPFPIEISFAKTNVGVPTFFMRLNIQHEMFQDTRSCLIAFRHSSLRTRQCPPRPIKDKCVNKRKEGES